jgi:hypothetical protein
MFIVIATHDTGHGQVSTPVYFVEAGISNVIWIARRITENSIGYGYEFLNNDAMVCVYDIKPLSICLKRQAADRIIFVRRYVRIFGQPPRWEEEWYSKEQEALYNDELRNGRV